MRIYQVSHTVQLGHSREDLSERMVYYSFYAHELCVYPSGREDHYFAEGWAKDYDPSTKTFRKTHTYMNIFNMIAAPDLLKQT